MHRKGDGKMKKTNKTAVKALCLLLAVLMIFSLSACSAGGDAEGDEPEQTVHTGKNVKSPSGVKYFTRNNLTTETVNINRDGSVRTEKYPSVYEYNQMSSAEKENWDVGEVYFSGYYMQISGLKDKETETAVNEKLKTLCTDNLDRIPPYRGIRAALGENPERNKARYSSAYQAISLNDNNILSATMYVSDNYKSVLTGNDGNRDDGDVYFSFEETLNIDLNTGEEIAIADMFCNDVDALAYINNFVSEAIADGNGDEEGWYAGADLKLTGPFTGIPADQKYSINEGGISLVFDYETPEFDTGFNPVFVTIPFSEEMALTERFFDEGKNIYESEKAPGRHFPHNTYDAQDYDRFIDEDGIIADKYYLTKRADCPKGVPKYINERMSDFVDIPEDEILREIESAVPEDADRDRLSADYYFTAYAYEIGPFVNINYSGYKNVHENRYDIGEAQKSYFHEEEERRETYDTRLKQNEPLELADIFKDGADIESIIKQALIGSINRGIENENSTRPENSKKLPAFTAGSGSEAEKLNEKYIDELYENIIYFSVSYDGINLIFDTPSADIYEGIYGVNPYDTEGGYVYVNSADLLNYELLDCDELTVFDF